MYRAVIPLLHKDCSLCDSTMQVKDLGLSVQTLRLHRRNYDVYVTINPEGGRQNIKDLCEARDKILKDPSTKQCASLTGPGSLDTNEYIVTVADRGYSLGATRIINRVEGAKIYWFVVGECRNGVEYHRIFFDDEETLNRTIRSLKAHDSITVIGRGDENLADQCGVNLDDTELQKVEGSLLDEFPNFFDDVIGVKNHQRDHILRLLEKNPKAVQECQFEETTMKVLLSWGPRAWKILETVMRIDTAERALRFLARRRFDLFP